MEIIPWNPLQHPLLSTTVIPSQQNQWCWIFGRSFYTFWTNTDLILKQIQRWIWEKQLIKPKSIGFTTITCYTQLHSILHFFITLPWTPPHTRTNNLSHTSFSSSFSLLSYTQCFFVSWYASMTFLELVPLVQWKLEILLHQSMASSSFKGQWEFENEWPSNWN